MKNDLDITQSEKTFHQLSTLRSMSRIRKLSASGAGFSWEFRPYGPHSCRARATERLLLSFYREPRCADLEPLRKFDSARTAAELPRAQRNLRRGSG